MKPFLRTSLICGTSLLYGSSAFAQVATPATQGSNSPAANGPAGCTASLILPVGTYSQGPSMGPYSPGGWAAAPYSAVEEFWVLQVLNDGTVASSKRQLTTKIYQDSHGRRRRERPICSQLYEDAEAVLVSIDDPVAGYEYDLDPQNRIAYRYSLKAIKDAVRAAGGNRPGPHMEVTKEPLGSQWMEGLLVVGTRETRRLIPAPAPDMEDLKTKEEIDAAKARLEVTTSEIEEKRRALEASHGEGLTSEEDYIRQRRELDERMHTAMLESFRVGYAERHAAKARNDQPFTIVEQVWYSSEIRAVVLEKSIDEGVERRLTNINRAEPDISLFQPPADYKIEDATSTVTIQIYPPPTLASISPASGIQGTNVDVTLTGTNFVVGGSTINVPPAEGITVSGTTVATATRSALVVHESITATLQISATASLGPQNVSVTTAAGTTLTQTFTVNPPVPRLRSLRQFIPALLNRFPDFLVGTDRQ